MDGQGGLSLRCRCFAVKENAPQNGPGPRDVVPPVSAPWVGCVRPREPRPGPRRHAVASPRGGVLSGLWCPATVQACHGLLCRPDFACSACVAGNGSTAPPGGAVRDAWAVADTTLTISDAGRLWKPRQCQVFSSSRARVGVFIKVEKLPP